MNCETGTRERSANLFIVALPCRCRHPWLSRTSVFLLVTLHKPFFTLLHQHNTYTQHSRQDLRTRKAYGRAQTPPSRLAWHAASCTSGSPPTMIIICLVGSSNTTWSPQLCIPIISLMAVIMPWKLCWWLSVGCSSGVRALAAQARDLWLRFLATANFSLSSPSCNSKILYTVLVWSLYSFARIKQRRESPAWKSKKDYQCQQIVSGCL